MSQTLVNRICGARKLAGLSPAQVARMLNVSIDRIQAIEADTVSVSAQEIEQFAEIFEVSKSWLIDKQRFCSNEILEDIFGITPLNLTPEELERLHTILTSIRGNQ
ncbi:helix-turn-helix transcriptional regulator [Microcoleus sp. B9-D4]|uniref:helix-turn-helix transcriptional regulator n=1 Tax=Microcoleus sp. B9-D4 TaxID=2818711 RepID=UPI002FD6E731